MHRLQVQTCVENIRAVHGLSLDSPNMETGPGRSDPSFQSAIDTLNVLAPYCRRGEPSPEEMLECFELVRDTSTGLLNRIPMRPKGSQPDLIIKTFDG